MVDDTGKGIAEDRRGRVFEPFVTGWEDEAGPEGTGLGLSVVRSIVSDHGGSVEAGTPESGIGARFVVHLPVEPATVAREAERA